MNFRAASSHEESASRNETLDAQSAMDVRQAGTMIMRSVDAISRIRIGKS